MSNKSPVFPYDQIPPLPPTRKHGLRPDLPAHGRQTLRAALLGADHAGKGADRQGRGKHAGYRRSRRGGGLQNGGCAGHAGKVSGGSSAALHPALGAKPFRGSLQGEQRLR